MKILGIIFTAAMMLMVPAAQAQHNKSQHGHTTHVTHGSGGNHTQHTSAEDRRHYDGRRFDRGWERDHFGFNHCFYNSSPIFINGGYRFWYGGFWFNYSIWPEDWSSSDPVYIEYDEAVSGYFVYNPNRPHFRVALGIVL